MLRIAPRYVDKAKAAAKSAGFTLSEGPFTFAEGKKAGLNISMCWGSVKKSDEVVMWFKR